MLTDKPKLITLLESFTPAEYRDFVRFVDSDMISTTPAVKLLLKEISSVYPKIQTLLSDKKNIYSSCFKDKTYNDKKVRYLLTDLTKAAESFLAFKVLMKKEDFQKNLVSEELSRRNCNKAYYSIYNYFKNSTAKLQDSEYFFHQYWAEYNHLVNEASKQKRNEESNIETVIENLDKFYIAQKLKLSCEVLNVKNILAKNYKAFLLDEIINYLHKNNYFQTPIINGYHLVLMTLTKENNEIYFNQLKDILKNNEVTFNQNDLRELYQYALNYCIKKINLGNSGYQRTLFDLYKIIVSNRIIFTENVISQFDYKNITTIALRLNEVAWAEEFIHQYKPFLAPSESENAFTYNLANIYFHKREFSKTLALLQKVDFTDIYYQLDSKTMILKIYFEENDEDAFLYHTAAFKSFIKRSKSVSDYQKNIYNNLIRHTTRLMKAENKNGIMLIKKDIEKTRQTADINWLLQKIEERINNT